MTTRYRQLSDMIAGLRLPTAAELRIVEVGVHRAHRATMMVLAALARSRAVSYHGFDVFETEDQAFHDAALNGKGIANQAEAEGRLRQIERNYRDRFTWRLTVGDTRETLHEKTIIADIAFIDGDHRVEVIRGDAAAMSGSCVLVFDDFYRPGPQGACPDLELHGANKVVEELRAAGASVDLLPAGDACKHGGIAHLAVVRRA